MIKFILFLFLPLYIFAVDDLSLLLDSYESQSALHHKTKDESAGHLKVYSRKDLDVMQAYTLFDIIKSIHGFTLIQDEKGTMFLQRAGASCGNGGCVRLYINDQEMSSAITGSALGVFSEYDLGHIDHIEIYTGGNAIKFGNEYGFLTIKLYTKDASRDNGGYFNTSYSSNDSYGFSAFNTGITDNSLEYLLYAKKKNIDKGNISNAGTVVPRYTESTNIYASLKRKNDFTFELSSYDLEKDTLAGIGASRTPQISENFSKYQYASFTKYFDSLKLQASYVKESLGMHNQDSNGITLHDGSTVTDLNSKFDNAIVKLSVEHSTAIGDHSLFYGVNYQEKRISSAYDTIVGTSEIDISSGFLEYSYNFNKNNLFLATGKWEHYKHKGYDRTDDIYQKRLGFVSLLNENITFKSFYADNYIYPALSEMVDFTWVAKGNPDLKPIDITNFSVEIIYANDIQKLSLKYLKMGVKDPIKINKAKRYFNKSVAIVFHDYFIDYEYKFNRNNKLQLGYYFTDHNIASDLSSTAGGNVKLFNSIGNFNFYNELIYRKSYISVAQGNMFVDDGYNYTSAITYNVNQRLRLALKGENLLDKSITSPIKNLGTVALIDRRVTLQASWAY